jgi:hypothetical protein
MGNKADAFCEFCAMRKIVLRQSRLSCVAKLLRCVLHDAAMQKLPRSGTPQFGIDFGIEQVHHSMR